jgi:anti-anti-sigma regulatory factor
MTERAVTEDTAMTGDLATEIVQTLAADGSYEVTHQVVRGWHLFIMRGEVSSAAGSTVVEILEKSVAEGATALIVDLARTSSVDPWFVTELARVDREVRASGGDLRLVVDGVAVLQAIRAAGLSGRFEIHRYVGDIVGAVPGLDEGGRGKRRETLVRATVTAHPAASRHSSRG